MKKLFTTILAILFLTTNSYAQVTSGLVSYWKFDENTNNNPATVNFYSIDIDPALNASEDESGGGPYPDGDTVTYAIFDYVVAYGGQKIVNSSSYTTQQVTNGGSGNSFGADLSWNSISYNVDGYVIQACSNSFSQCWWTDVGNTGSLSDVTDSGFDFPDFGTPGNFSGISGYTVEPYGIASPSAIADSSGNSHTAYVISPSTWYAWGQLNSAMSFNGTNQWVVVPNLDMQTFTVLMWIKRGRVSAGGLADRLLVGSYGSWGFFIDSTSNHLGETYTGFNGVDSTGTITDTTKWHQVGMSIDGTYVYFWIDGKLDSKKNFPGGTFSSPRQYAIANVTASAPGGGWDVQFYQGVIDEVRVYNRVLLASEIKYLYNDQSAVLNNALIQNAVIP